MIRLKRIYEMPDKNDGLRILVDRLWPRGIKKKEAKVDLWLKDIAPSAPLRKWFSHDQKKWEEFQKRYFKELDDKTEWVSQIAEKSKKETITLLYSSKEEKLNNAVALAYYIQNKFR